MVLSNAASFVAAQPSSTSSAQAPAPEGPLPPIFSPRSPVQEANRIAPAVAAQAQPPSRRALSPGMSAKLAAAIAERTPPAPATSSPGAAPTTTSGDSSGAVQLRPYIVSEDRVLDFKERDILTAKGKAALARSRYPGLGFLTDAAAVKWIAEQHAKERRQEMTDLGSLIEIGGGKPPPELNRVINESKDPQPFPSQFGRPSGPP